MFYFSNSVKLNGMTVLQTKQKKLLNLFSFAGREHNRRDSASGGDDFGARWAGYARVRIPAGRRRHIQADGFGQLDRQSPVVEVARLLFQELVVKVCLFRVVCFVFIERRSSRSQYLMKIAVYELWNESEFIFYGYHFIW